MLLDVGLQLPHFVLAHVTDLCETEEKIDESGLCEDTNGLHEPLFLSIAQRTAQTFAPISGSRLVINTGIACLSCTRYPSSKMGLLLFSQLRASDGSQKHCVLCLSSTARQPVT